MLTIKGKDIVILGDGATQRLDDTTLTAEAKYPLILLNQIENCIKFAL